MSSISWVLDRSVEFVFHVLLKFIQKLDLSSRVFLKTGSSKSLRSKKPHEYSKHKISKPPCLFLRTVLPTFSSSHAQKTSFGLPDLNCNYVVFGTFKPIPNFWLHIKNLVFHCKTKTQLSLVPWKTRHYRGTAAAARSARGSPVSVDGASRRLSPLTFPWWRVAAAQLRNCPEMGVMLGCIDKCINFAVCSLIC